MDMQGRTRVRQAEVPDKIAEWLGSLQRLRIGRIKTLDRCLDLSPHPGFVDAQQTATAQHETTIDHDAVDGGTVLCKHQLPQRVAQWHVVDVADIKKDDVGPIARLQSTDAIKAEDGGATLG